MAVALAALAFASCKKDNAVENKDNSDMTSVTLTLKDGMATRAQGPSIADQTVVSLTGGKLYFVDGTGSITKAMTIVTAGGTTATNFDVTVAGAQTINNVPSTTTEVYVVGNIAGLPVAGSITAVQNTLTTINAQYDAVAKGVANVTLFGKQTMTQVTPVLYTATVLVKPITSRIEIAKFTQTGSLITQYRVDGIFIHNNYAKSKLSGVMSNTVTPANDLLKYGPEANPQIPTIYVGGSTQFPAADAGIYYDYSAAGIGTFTAATQEYTPAAGTVWAYNLLAPTDGTAFPNIEIMLTDFNASAGLLAKQYITVTGFEDVAVPGTPLTFDAGKIYKIQNFTFDESNLKTGPAISSVTAQVTVTLAKWDEQLVNPIM